MTYHSTSGTAASSADFLVKLKDFLVTTCGWTLHDDGSATANPYFVLRSFGESGAEDIYLQLINDSGTDRISVHAFLYWDAGAHTGVKEAYYSSQTYLRTVDASSFFYWVYADLDHFFVVTKVVATYYGQYSGAFSAVLNTTHPRAPPCNRRNRGRWGCLWKTDCSNSHRTSRSPTPKHYLTDPKPQNCCCRLRRNPLPPYPLEPCSPACSRGRRLAHHSPRDRSGYPHHARRVPTPLLWAACRPPRCSSLQPSANRRPQRGYQRIPGRPSGWSVRSRTQKWEGKLRPPHTWHT